jgi:hypothetical protein
MAYVSLRWETAQPQWLFWRENFCGRRRPTWRRVYTPSPSSAPSTRPPPWRQMPCAKMPSTSGSRGRKKRGICSSNAPQPPSAPNWWGHASAHFFFIVFVACLIFKKVIKYVMLCYVMLCYVMLCYVMLCYVMLCYVTLCYVMFHERPICSSNVPQPRSAPNWCAQP